MRIAQASHPGKGMQGIDLPGFPAEDGGFEEVMRLSLLKGAG
jgi:hypothetical protein